MEKLIYENSDNKYIETDMTKNITEWAQQSDLNNISLIGYRCFLLRSKSDDSGEFVLFDESGKPCYSNQNAEHIGAHIDMLKTIKQFERKDI